ncbi:hypothetical protein E1B28_009734 [Marasmius oreades]|uniref:Uncharacterized protein n=1 Tax=Marasmius oreades TaxID=181124 RepID=A0A9P7UQE9_9AGAR|nr:uncharacterized protein E1B28_009734 [Marasmius oreades]KAG7090632.1 hypothetical protein E1B28_009734 [Marasmius oreades]
MVMQSSGGYSAFFSSGYRAIRAPGTGEPLANKPFPHPFLEYAICQDCECTNPLRPLPEVSRKRRNSVIRFFDKVASNATDVKERRRRSFVDFDLWTRVGLQRSTSRNSCAEKSPLQPQTIDPFSSSPESKSFFIELADSPIHIKSPSSFSRSKRNTLLFSPSSTTRDSSFTKRERERPTSVHTLPTCRPTDPRRRHSSIYSVPSSYLGKMERELDLGSSVEKDLSLPLPEESEWSDPGELDWRQFHFELLDGF